MRREYLRRAPIYSEHGCSADTRDIGVRHAHFAPVGIRNWLPQNEVPRRARARFSPHSGGPGPRWSEYLTAAVFHWPWVCRRGAPVWCRWSAPAADHSGIAIARDEWWRSVRLRPDVRLPLFTCVTW